MNYLFIVAVSIVIIEDNKVLLAKRSAKKDAGANLWEFPSGRLISGEDPENAVIREGKEELGVEVLPIKVVDSYFFKRNGIDSILINYYCKINGSPDISNEHSEIIWATQEEARNLLLFEKQIQTLKESFRIFLSNSVI